MTGHRVIGLGALAGLMVLAGVLRWRYAVVTVRGPSMAPDLANGDQLLARRCAVGRLRPGDLVIFREPGLPRRRPVWLTGPGADLWVVKRVAAVAGDRVPDAVRPAAGAAAVVPPGAIVVLGSGPGSRDSRQWGFIPASQVFGRAARSHQADPKARAGQP